MVDKGLTDQLKGKTKKIVGDLTGDTVTKAEGWLEQGVGKTHYPERSTVHFQH